MELNTTTVYYDGKEYQLDILKAIKDGYLKPVYDPKLGDFYWGEDYGNYVVISKLYETYGAVYFYTGLEDQPNLPYSSGLMTYDQLKASLASAKRVHVGNINSIVKGAFANLRAEHRQSKKR